MRKLRQRRVLFTCPKAHTQQTHGRIWLRNQLSDSDFIACDTACHRSPRPGLAWPWMPPPPNQPATPLHCQMSLATRQTQNDNEVGFKKKKKEREREESRGWEKTVLITNFSLALFPDLKILARLAKSGAGEERLLAGSGVAKGPERAAPTSPSDLPPRTSCMIAMQIQNKKAGPP